MDCIAAISLTPLNDLYLPRGYDFSWLRKLTPIAKAGESIWIYDLRRKDPRGAMIGLCRTP